MDTEMESFIARKKAKHVLAWTMVELPEWIIKTFKSLLNTALESPKETVTCNLLV